MLAGLLLAHEDGNIQLEATGVSGEVECGTPKRWKAAMMGLGDTVAYGGGIEPPKRGSGEGGKGIREQVAVVADKCCWLEWIS